MSRRKTSKRNNKPYAAETSRGQTIPKKSNEELSESKSDGGVKEYQDKKEAEAKAKEPITEARHAMNDPAWYMQYPELAVDSASIPYSDPLGASIKLSAEDGFNYGVDGFSRRVVSSRNTDEFTFPGILSLVVKHTIGHSLNKVDAVNVAANALYTNVRFVNSGRKNYDPADLFMYCLVMAEIYSFIEWCKRLYGKAFIYSQVNKYIGEAIIEADNVDAQDLMYNLANFRMWLNTFINKVSAYAVPAGIPYFMRRVFMYSSVYTESETGNIKDQLYQFSPSGFYTFQLDDKGAGMLKYSLFGFRDGGDGALIRTVHLSTTQIMQYGNNMLSTIAGDEDFGLISGDILKAYDGNIIPLSVLSPDYVIVPVHDLDVLRQFRNANMVGLRIDVGNENSARFTLREESEPTYYRCGNVYQDVATGNIVCYDSLSTTFEFDIVANRMNRMIDLNSPAPTVADNLECSRLMNYSDWVSLISPSNTDPINRLVLFSGTEIPLVAYITYNKVTPGSVGIRAETRPINAYIAEGALGEISVTHSSTLDLMLVTHFHYAPFVYMMIADFEQEEVDVHEVMPIQNVDNYVFISQHTLQKMHDCALLSMFFAPGVAKVVSVTR